MDSRPTSPLPISDSRRTLLRALSRRKKRRERGLFLAEGVRLLSELVSVPELIEFLYVHPEMVEQIPTELASCTTYLIGSEESDLFSTEHPQGVGAVVRMPQSPSLNDLQTLRIPLLFLDGVSDPGNAGTIIRGADWFGIDWVLFGKGSVDPWNPKTVRASMGGSFRVTIVEGVSVAELLSLNRQVYLLSADGESVLGETSPDPTGIYVIGSEAHGISPEWEESGLSERVERLSIPRVGSGESLNAAMAATILCWELSRVDERSG
ncbi:MAG: TrmH family RNA methyltransferase [Candidatus Kapaibacterium sp.]